PGSHVRHIHAVAFEGLVGGIEDVEIGGAEGAELLSGVIHVGAAQLAIILVKVALEVEGRAADGLGVELDNSRHVEGQSRRKPISRVPVRVEMAVPDEESIADVEVLTADGNVDRIITERGNEFPGFPSSVELIKSDVRWAVDGKVGGIAATSGRGDTRDGTVGGPEIAGIVAEVDFGQQVAFGIVDIVVEVPVRSERAGAEIRVACGNPAEAGLDLRAEGEPALGQREVLCRGWPDRQQYNDTADERRTKNSMPGNPPRSI